MTIDLYGDTVPKAAGLHDFFNQAPDTVNAAALDTDSAQKKRNFLEALGFPNGEIPTGGAALTSDQAAKLALITGGSWTNAAGPITSNPAVFAASNAKLTASNIVSLTYQTTIVAPTDIDDEWFGIRLPEADVANVEKRRLEIGSNVVLLSDSAVEEVTTAGGFAYYQWQGSATRGDTIRIQLRGQFSFDGDEINWDTAGIRQIPDTDGLGSSDDGDILAFDNGEGGVIFGGFASTHGFEVTFDGDSDNFDLRQLWCYPNEEALPTGSAIAGDDARWSEGDFAIVAPQDGNGGGVYRLNPATGATNTFSTSLQLGESGNLRGWDRDGEDTEFGTQLIAEFDVFTASSTGLITMEVDPDDRPALVDWIDYRKDGHEYHLTPSPTPGGEGNYFNGNAFPQPTTAATQQTWHASKAIFTSTAVHWSKVISFAAAQDPRTREIVSGIEGGTWTDTTGTVTEEIGVTRVPQPSAYTASNIVTALYGLSQDTPNQTYTDGWLAVRVPLSEVNLRARRRWVVGAEIFSLAALTEVTRNSTDAFYQRQFDSIPPSITIKTQRLTRFSLSPHAFSNVLPTDANVGDVPQFGADGDWNATAPGPGIGNDTRAALRRGQTAVFTVASRAWTSQFFSTGWMLPEEGTYEVLLTRAGNRTEPVIFSASDVRSKDEETPTADTTQAAVSYHEVDGIRFGRTAGNTLLIAVASNTTTAMAGYSFGVNATFSNVRLAAPVYMTLPADFNLDLDDAANTFTTTYQEITGTRYTATESLDGTYFWSFNPKASWDPGGGGDRAAVHFRVRHMRPGSPNDTLVQLLGEAKDVYIRNQAAGGVTQEGTLQGLYSSSAPVQMQANDYLMVDAIAWAQIAAGGSGTNRTSSDTIEINIADTQVSFRQLKAVSNVGITDNQVVAIVDRVRPLNAVTRTPTQYAAETKDDETIYFVGAFTS